MILTKARLLRDHNTVLAQIAQAESSIIYLLQVKQGIEQQLSTFTGKIIATIGGTNETSEDRGVRVGELPAECAGTLPEDQQGS
jgi:hypothetical protein